VVDEDLDRVIGDCALYENGWRRPGRLSLAEATCASQQGKGFVWLGLREPDPVEVAEVASRFQLPALAVEDAVKAHQRPKLEVYDGVLFMILKPVRYVDHEEVVDVGQIALFVGPAFVVSVRHGDNTVLHRVRTELDADGTDPAPEDRGDDLSGRHAPHWVLYRAADLVVDGYEEALQLINEDVDEIESQVFDASQSVDHFERIYKLKREIAEFRRAVVPLADPLQRLLSGQVRGTNGHVAPYFRNVHDHLLRVAEAIEAHDRLLSDVLQANLARVATVQNQIAIRQNEDMRRISAWAAIALVPTAVAGVYGMNFDNMPELHWAYGYFLVLGIVGTACTTLYFLFRRNNWL
jgi:magnesium transporter